MSADTHRTLRRWAYAAGYIETELDGASTRMHAAIRAEVLAEAKFEVVAWLAKKAAEKGTWDASVLASKVDRGAVRIFLGTAHYRDAADAQAASARVAGLLDAAEIVGNDDDCECGGCDSCIPRALARRIRDRAYALARGEG